MNPDHRHALVVAVSKFDDDDIQDLPGAAIDGERMKAFLRDPERGAFGGDVTLLQSPTLKSIQLALGDLFARAAEHQGMALVYFATHGVSEGPGGLWLAPQDAIFGRRTTTMLPLTAAAAALSEHRVPRTVTVLDVCEAGGHSAGASRLAADKLWSDILLEQPNPEGHFLLGACGTREASSESGTGGCFTSLLLEIPAAVGEANPAKQWIQTEALAQALGRAAEDRGLNQRPEWSGLSVAIDVPFCRNPSHDANYTSPHALLGAASFSSNVRAALQPSIGGFWNAYRRIGTSGWLQDAVGSALAVAKLTIPDQAKIEFWVHSLDSAARRVESHGGVGDRAELHGFAEETLIRLGRLGADESEEAAFVHATIGRTASEAAEDLEAFASDAGWIAAEDGPAAIGTSPIRFWDRLGHAASVAIAAREIVPVASGELIQRIEATVSANERLHRVVWAGQYPDFALVLGLLLHSNPSLAQSCADRTLSDLPDLYSRDQWPASAELRGRDLGRYLSALVCGEAGPRPRHADEGPALFLLALQATEMSEVALSSVAARISESKSPKDLCLYVPASVKAQLVAHMTDCKVMSWPATENRLAAFLSLELPERAAPFDTGVPPAIDLLMSAAAGRVFRNRAVAGLLAALPAYLAGTKRTQLHAVS